MKNSSLFIQLVCILMLSACTKEQLYNLTQPDSSVNRQRECSEVPRSQRAECHERSMSYEEYEKARKETLGE